MNRMLRNSLPPWTTAKQRKVTEPLLKQTIPKPEKNLNWKQGDENKKGNYGICGEYHNRSTNFPKPFITNAKDKVGLSGTSY